MIALAEFGGKGCTCLLGIWSVKVGLDMYIQI
jgi:hypothetical protein